MEIDALLCDHAEVADGKLFINGGAINLLYVPPQPPYVISLFVAVIVHVPYTETNQGHVVTVRLLDADGDEVAPWVPPGAGPVGPVQASTSFTVGRPANLQPGESQTMPLAFGLQGLPLANLGSYSFVIEIDGTVEKHLSARLVVDSRGAGTPGPSDIPGLTR